MKKILLLGIAVVFSCFTFGQSNMQKAQQELKSRGEVYFKFTINNTNGLKKTVNELSNIISIDNIVGNEVTCYANASEFAKFTKLNINFTLPTPPSLLYKPHGSTVLNITDWDYYPTYTQYVDMMNQFVNDYPNLCELVNIGSTVDDRQLLFIHINDSLGVSQNEPEFMYTSTMHGDEVTGYVLMLRYINYLLQNYGTNSTVTNLVNNVDIWINPLANPDGTYAGGNNTVYGATRTNANNVDLNRNYPDPDDGPHPDGNAYQPETVAFMDFADTHNFVMSSNMHGGAEVVNYPWDTWATLTADNNWWVSVCREYADTAQANSPSGYLTDQNNGITNGYAWYAISGGRQDYMNYYHNCREMTLELSSVKIPQESQLPYFWNYNYRSFDNYMEQSLFGFGGIVTNEVTGNAVAAKITVNNHDFDNSWVYSHLPLGNYFRPIKQGTYDITFSAFGYYNTTVNNVSVVDNLNTVLNVQLTPYTSLTADFTSSATDISLGDGIDFYDASWGNNITSWQWTFEGGNPATSSDENPTGIIYQSAGDYNVTLVVTDVDGDTDTNLKENFIHVSNSYNMSNGTVSACNALFLDSGGENNNYSNNEDYVMTFLPDTSNSSVKVEFTEFSVESQSSCDYDYLEIYNGSDVNAPLLGRWCGTISPGTITANNDEGALTFYFHSDNSVTLSGWKATILCDTGVGVAGNTLPKIAVFPNPASTKLQISSEYPISSIVLKDISGRTIYHRDFANGNYSINTANFERGIYLLSFVSNGSIITIKVVLN